MGSSFAEVAAKSLSQHQKDGPMPKFEFSEHAYDMLIERNIKEAWVELVISEPEKKELKDDGTAHYIKAIDQHGGRYLRVVVDPHYTPLRIITLFFDRRMGRAL